MMDSEITMLVSQFGAAGLMGLLWIAERRQAAQRERQLSEAHRLLMSRESEAAALLGVVRDNTRAIVTLEQTQRRLMHALERMNERPNQAPAAARRAQPAMSAAAGDRDVDAA